MRRASPEATKDPRYVEKYCALWHYCWEHWVDHQHGGFRNALGAALGEGWLCFKMSRDNKRFNDEKAIVGGKCDYHTLVSCAGPSSLRRTKLRFRPKRWGAFGFEEKWSARVASEFSPRTEATEPMETVILEKTIIKLGSLLALGFGEAGESVTVMWMAGANIVSSNMAGANSGVNAMVEGSMVDCIVVGLARILNFSTATEVLQGKVMTFVNQIAEIVHGVVDECWGAVNKNDGDCFLIIWRLAELTLAEGPRRHFHRCARYGWLFGFQRPAAQLVAGKSREGIVNNIEYVWPLVVMRATLERDKGETQDKVDELRRTVAEIGHKGFEFYLNKVLPKELKKDKDFAADFALEDESRWNKGFFRWQKRVYSMVTGIGVEEILWDGKPVPQLPGVSYAWDELHSSKHMQSMTVKKILGHMAAYKKASEATVDPSAKRFRFIPWVEVYRAGEFQVSHTHTGSPVVGILALRCNGKQRMSFEDPRGVNPPFGWKHHIDFREGDLIMFPSWASHLMEPNRGNGTNVFLSFAVQESPEPRESDEEKLEDLPSAASSSSTVEPELDEERCGGELFEDPGGLRCSAAEPAEPRCCAAGRGHEGWEERLLACLAQLRKLEQEHGEEDLQVALCLRDLGALLARRGRAPQAIPLWIRVLEIERPLLGSQHPDVLLLERAVRQQLTQLEPLAAEAYEAQLRPRLEAHDASADASADASGDSQPSALRRTSSALGRASVAASAAVGSAVVGTAMSASLTAFSSTCSLVTSATGSLVSYGAACAVGGEAAPLAAQAAQVALNGGFGAARATAGAAFQVASQAGVSLVATATGAAISFTGHRALDLLGLAEKGEDP
ncbi:unnamed protein product [Effrenium voratum]|nr:unnamed protein product [Effrenium voratum]